MPSSSGDASKTVGCPTRRQVVKNAAAVAATAGIGPFFHVRPARASKRLKILQWNHFVLSYDKWFNETFVKEWGDANDTEVIVDRVAEPTLNLRAEAEVSAQDGHDLFMFVTPPPKFEDHVIDHAEIYDECERRYGKPIDLAIKSTFNPKTKKFIGFSDAFSPDPINYRKDLWDDIGVKPDSWENIRQGGRAIKERHGVPVGIGLSPEIDTGMAMRSILYAFGGSVQSDDGALTLKSKETLDAIKYVRALYREAMTAETLTWDSASNNNYMLSGKGSLTVNAISITRVGEAQRIPVTDQIFLARPPSGPVRAIGLEHIISVYVIWRFAKNIDGAKKFLIDYIGQSRKAFEASRFYNFPTFPDTVPDLEQRLANDPNSQPADKYAILRDVLSWTVNVGYPGYTTAAIDETFNRWILNSMFAKAATGAASPEEALDVAHAQCVSIWEKWQNQGKI